MFDGTIAQVSYMLFYIEFYTKKFMRLHNPFVLAQSWESLSEHELGQLKKDLKIQLAFIKSAIDDKMFSDEQVAHIEAWMIRMKDSFFTLDIKKEYLEIVESCE
ncbi:hypothetical protein [Candidatus Sneabacter namystus]|uniref:Uncharacterized protein n=1 Tax=Candidatus Sneabacter namystus TaxID=2601646 RepID=A0A5C0UHT9_9RICK|nr:hypothetical protein [Candidatus Sneabacter namystus]QEK39755.1 hypothetical protein FZC37_02340 [Candidatus Sneabacter namystus]